jgi:hypothetical protein
MSQGDFGQRGPGKAFAFPSRDRYGVITLSYGDLSWICGLLGGHTYDSCAMDLSDSSYLREDSAALDVCSRALHDVSHALVLRRQGKSEQAGQMHRQGLENYEKVLGNVQVQFDLARSMAKNKSMARSQLVLETVRGIRDVLESGLHEIALASQNPVQLR